MNAESPACPTCRSTATGPFCAYCGAATPVAPPATWQSAWIEESTPPFVAHGPYREAATLGSILVQPFLHVAHIPPKTRRAIVMLALFGVVPLAASVLTKSTAVQFWLLAFYFSLLWTAFFAVLYHDEGADPKIALAMYFGTGIVSMPLLALVLQSGLEQTRDLVVDSPHPFVALPANIIFVGIPEELAKVVVLFILCAVIRLPPLRLFIFYGLISGLGFGFYEAIEYQRHIYLEGAMAHLATTSTALAQQQLATYYVLSVLRLTSSPFFHAVWTGIAAFFIWFGMRFARHRVGFIAIALLVPAILHGLYDGFLAVREPALTVLVALLSAGLLGLFIGSAPHLERTLELADGERRPQHR